MSAPFKVPLKIYQGATFSKSLTWKTAPDELTAKTPVDLTGCTARMQVRAKAGAATVLLSLTTENGGISLGWTAAAIDKLFFWQASHCRLAHLAEVRRHQFPPAYRGAVSASAPGIYYPPGADPDDL